MSFFRICLTDKSYESGLLFWKDKGKGYTSNFDEAGIFEESYDNEDTLSIQCDAFRETCSFKKIVDYTDNIDKIKRIKARGMIFHDNNL